jgi:hypothetical protein
MQLENMPPVVSRQEWQAAWEEMLVKEKDLTRARDALAAERRRMPRMAVEKVYRFEGPNGPASLLDLFDRRRQLVVYRFFFEPGVADWPEGGCRGCSVVTGDQVSHLAHLNARDTTLAFVSRAPQPDIERWKARMGWEQIPWYTLTDDFDADFGVDERHQRLLPRRRRPDLPHLLHQRARRRGAGQHLQLPRHDRARTPRGVGGLARGPPADPACRSANRRVEELGPIPVVEPARRVREGRRVIAHVGGLPLEERLPLIPGSARCWARRWPVARTPHARTQTSSRDSSKSSSRSTRRITSLEIWRSFRSPTRACRWAA